MADYKRFFTLFRQATAAGLLPFDSHHDLVEAATEGRTTSLRDLSAQELATMERRIQDLLAPQGDSANRMRRKVIAILAARGAVDAQGRPDMTRIHAWVRKYGHLHKDFNAYTVPELITLVTQAEAIVASDLKAIQKHHG